MERCFLLPNPKAEKSPPTPNASTGNAPEILRKIVGIQMQRGIEMAEGGVCGRLSYSNTKVSLMEKFFEVKVGLLRTLKILYLCACKSPGVEMSAIPESSVN